MVIWIYYKTYFIFSYNYKIMTSFFLNVEWTVEKNENEFFRKMSRKNPPKNIFNLSGSAVLELIQQCRGVVCGTKTPSRFNNYHKKFVSPNE